MRRGDGQGVGPLTTAKLASDFDAMPGLVPGICVLQTAFNEMKRGCGH